MSKKEKCNVIFRLYMYYKNDKDNKYFVLLCKRNDEKGHTVNYRLNDGQTDRSAWRKMLSLYFPLKNKYKDKLPISIEECTIIDVNIPETENPFLSSDIICTYAFECGSMDQLNMLVHQIKSNNKIECCSVWATDCILNFEKSEDMIPEDDMAINAQLQMIPFIKNEFGVIDIMTNYNKADRIMGEIEDEMEDDKEDVDLETEAEAVEAEIDSILNDISGNLDNIESKIDERKNDVSI